MKKKIQTTRKRLLSVLLAVVMVLTALPLTALSAVAATSGDFEYQVLSETDKTCQITGYTGSATELTIPSKLDGYTVTSIGNYAFSFCTLLTSITIPNNVTSIGVGAFRDCASLTSIAIPDSVTSIGGWAFINCALLTSMIIPNSVTSIGDEAFSGCSSLTSVDVAAGNPNYISENGVLFNKAKTELIQYPAGKLDTSYTIPNSVTSISEGAFEDCAALTSITIPDSVTSIDNYAFFDSGLTTICGYTGSYAETYADENGYTFVALSSGDKGGDINGDDKINAVDARWILQVASGARTL